MDWLAHVSDGGFLRSVFGGRAPLLDLVEVHELAFQREGPVVLIRFDLSEFPATLPKAWAGAGYNVVQVRLMAMGIVECHVEGWHTSMSGRMTIERDGLVVCAFTGEGSRFRIAAEHLRVHAVSGYLRTCDM